MNKTVSEDIARTEICANCSELFRSLRRKVSALQKDNQSLAYMLEFKTAALKNREEIIQKLIQENRSLFESNQSLQKKRHQPSEVPIKPVPITHPQPRMTNTSHYIPPIKTLRSSSTDLKTRSVSTSYRRNNESQCIRKITQFSGVETVTESQGFPDFRSLLNNREGRRSILNPEEMKQLDQTGLKKLEAWIFAPEGLKTGLEIKEQIELQENLKSFFCDFKRVIKTCANLKKAIKSLFAISSSLDLELNIQRISLETCDSLVCEKVQRLAF